MRTQSSSGGRRKRLDGISFVQQIFFVKFFEEVPARFYVRIFISDIRMIEVDPVAHFFGQVVPYIFVFHHLLTAGFVVIFNGNFFADIFFAYAQCFLYTDFDWQTMRVPTSLTFYLESL